LDQQVTPIIVKLGGSVITIKDRNATPNHNAIQRLASEIAGAHHQPLILVHGGGSFGHPLAKKYQLMEGYKTEKQLMGVSKTRQAMMTINKLIIDSLVHNQIPAVAVQPSSCVLTNNKRIHEFYTRPIGQILKHGMIPVLFGDVVLDLTTGFTILSGDQIMAELATRFNSNKVIVGVDVDGLFTDNPKVNPHATLIQKVTLAELTETLEGIGEATSLDVTGGMYGKMVELIPVIEQGATITMVNALIANRLTQALRGDHVKSTQITRK
jgi:isopentenyl phosphate kinase